MSLIYLSGTITTLSGVFHGSSQTKCIFPTNTVGINPLFPLCDYSQVDKWKEGKALNVITFKQERFIQHAVKTTSSVRPWLTLKYYSKPIQNTEVHLYIWTHFSWTKTFIWFQLDNNITWITFMSQILNEVVCYAELQSQGIPASISVVLQFLERHF